MEERNQPEVQRAEPLPKLTYTIKEATKVANVGRTLLYEAIRHGTLKTLKVAGRRLVTPDQLKSWLHSHEV